MKLLLKSQHEHMLRNGQANANRCLAGEDTIDFPPVVKLFTPDAACTWLLSELDPDDPDIAFGLCDLGFGTPELGSIRISELEQVKGRLGLPVERDMHFQPKHTLAVYSRAAWNAACITEASQELEQAAAKAGGKS
ncbi:MAG: DUF2958 domain-containing protein [Candidatus Thiodiazotropha endolucinida]|nr:DUF2958 domain-containing protein [Candidatus Thiodiazotropha taylori]MCW4343712.1 DUF2958 domain-containing protein [Candidatus Thiodiazotropha endolucinida]MCG8046008.1 DUF2958 domain-containing protein [Candidatus Thiodiazotropha taylori]MCG8051888.1 DUF2958 domain-containing protein [Candidatus Thiodiazotropha taylori]MCW4313707.1 DUF2958 domain-containing protein [Candidatus Thiodiazotropha taylori]